LGSGFRARVRAKVIHLEALEELVDFFAIEVAHEHRGQSTAEVDLIDLVSEREVEPAEDLDHPPQSGVESLL